MVKPIKTDADYESSLQRIYHLIQSNPGPDTEEGDELEILTLLVKAYEEVHYPFPSPNPIDAIRFRLDQMGLSEEDLSRILGSRSRKSEILSGRRKLSIAMIRKINNVLKIPAEILIQAY